MGAIFVFQRVVEAVVEFGRIEVGGLLINVTGNNVSAATAAICLGAPQRLGGSDGEGVLFTLSARRSCLQRWIGEGEVKLIPDSLGVDDLAPWT